MPRIKAKPVTQDSRTAKKPAAKDKSFSQKTVARDKSASPKPEGKATGKAITERTTTKGKIISALQKVARELGHTPSSEAFYHHSGVSRAQVAWRFQNYRDAVRAAGLQPNQMGMRVETATLLEDWGRVAREAGKVPARAEYEQAGNYSRRCFTGRFQSWMEVPAEFCKAVAAGGLSGDWTDVLEMIREATPTAWECTWMTRRRDAVRTAYRSQAMGPEMALEGLAGKELAETEFEKKLKIRQDAEMMSSAEPITPIPPPLMGKKLVTATMLAVFVAELAPTALQWVTGACFQRRELKDRPLLGAAIQLPGLAHEPVNEMGVVLLFGMVARQLGFIVESVQTAFPDCEAKMEVHPGRWQRVRIEFEYESRAFKKHCHDPEQCDLIICWRHNWPGSPPKLQVLELSRVIEKIGTSGRAMLTTDSH
jgi:hypothetical protein